MTFEHPLWANLFKIPTRQQAEIDLLWMQTPLFADIPRRYIRPITEALTLRHYEPGEFVFRAGEIGVGAALIFKGRVSISASDNRLASLTNGDLFGEVALATDEPRTADAIAEESTDLIFFMKQDLDDLIKQNPAVATQFAMNLARMLAVRLRNANIAIQTTNTP